MNQDSTPGYISKENNGTNLKRHMHPYVHSNTIYNSQKVETIKCSSVDEWVNKMWYIYTVEYCSAIKRNEVPKHINSPSNSMSKKQKNFLNGQKT